MCEMEFSVYVFIPGLYFALSCMGVTIILSTSICHTTLVGSDNMPLSVVHLHKCCKYLTYLYLYFHCDLPELMYFLLNDLSLQKSAFHRPQTLGYKNGFALPRRPIVGIGQDPLLSEQLLQQHISELSCDTPDIPYGSFDQGVMEDFIPAHVALDKKVQNTPVFEDFLLLSSY